jgi:hypothetical protein
MSDVPKKMAANFEVNSGNVLLLFTEEEAEIVRSWRKRPSGVAITSISDPPIEVLI